MLLKYDLHIFTLLGVNCKDTIRKKDLYFHRNRSQIYYSIS